MISTSGSRLLKDDAADALIEMLIPLAEMITPNIPRLRSERDQDNRPGGHEEAARIITRSTGTNTLIKGALPQGG